MPSILRKASQLLSLSASASLAASFNSRSLSAALRIFSRIAPSTPPVPPGAAAPSPPPGGGWRVLAPGKLLNTRAALPPAGGGGAAPTLPLDVGIGNEEAGWGMGNERRELGS